MKVISFYTDEHGEAQAERLSLNLQRFGITSEIEKVQDRGSYHKNRLNVPSWILWKLLDDPENNVAWLNVSAKVMMLPKLLFDPPADLALFSPAGEYWAKTMYVRNSDASRRTMKLWADLNHDHPDVISCSNLKQAIKEMKPTITFLPPTYSWLEESFKQTYVRQIPVIVHELEGP